MSSPFKMNPGRGQMQKTGRGIPQNMCSPVQQSKKQIREASKNIAAVHNAGGNVTGYTSKGSKRKYNSSAYVGKVTKGKKPGVAYDASEINNAAIMNYFDGLGRSRDSISPGQVEKLLRKNGTFNSNDYFDSGETYEKRNDAYDKIVGLASESPLEQTDAISGKKVPANAIFGKTKTSVDELGRTVYTNSYETPGTPGSPGGPNPSKPDMPDPDWIKFKKNETPEHKAERLGRKGTSGTIERRISNPKMAGIKPLDIKVEKEIIKHKVTPTRGDTPFKPIHGQVGLDSFTRGVKKGKSWLFSGGNGGNGGFKPGCY